MKSFASKSGLGLLLAIALASASSISSAQNSTTPSAQAKTEALWFGQAGFRIKSPQGKMI